MGQGTMAQQPKRTPLGWVLTIIGSVFVAVTLILAVMLALPNLLGWQQFTVMTGSMEPNVPVGSMVYISSVSPSEIAEGDIVTFSRGDEVVTHRVVSNHLVEGELVTKGDANEAADPMPVAYGDVVGKAVLTLPALGDVFGALSTLAGKIYLLAFGICGVMLVILGGRLRQRPEATH